MGNTAIHKAVESGNMEIVQRLINTFLDARDVEDKVATWKDLEGHLKYY